MHFRTEVKPTTKLAAFSLQDPFVILSAVSEPVPVWCEAWHCYKMIRKKSSQLSRHKLFVKDVKFIKKTPNVGMVILIELWRIVQPCLLVSGVCGWSLCGAVEATHSLLRGATEARSPLHVQTPPLYCQLVCSGHSLVAHWVFTECSLGAPLSKQDHWADGPHMLPDARHSAHSQTWQT